MTDADVTDTRDAANELAEAVRELIVATIATEGSAATRRAFAGRISALAADLSAEPSRTIDELPSIDDRAALITYYSAGAGTANPLSAVIALSSDDQGVTGRVTMGRQFEGPPRFVHGGWTANLFDEVLGKAATWAGYWGLTVNLDVDYRRPVPLEHELELRARVIEASGRKVICTGELVDAAEPDVVLAQGRVTYVIPRPEVQAAYFAGVTGGDGVSTENMLPSAPRVG